MSNNHPHHDDLFEINFNSKEVAKSALNAPIQCGFEAETVWPNVEDKDDYEDEQWLDNLNWSSVNDLIYDQEGARAVERVYQRYRIWLTDEILYDFELEVISEIVAERKKDESVINHYVDDMVDNNDVEVYKSERLEYFLDQKTTLLAKAKAEQEDSAGEPKLVQRYIKRANDFQEEIDARQDWDYDAWAHEYVEQEKEDELTEWLEDQIRDNGEAYNEARSRAVRTYDVDDWIAREHGGSWYSLLSELDIFLVNPNTGKGRGAIAKIIEDWATKNSISADVRLGEYHSGKRLDNDYWRIENDSSIEGNGAHAEIVSPVYDTPAQMLSELKGLMKLLNDNDVVTNSSTGLHITMSNTGSQVDLNRLKMVVLLGDPYLLKQFERQHNDYTKSQEKLILRHVKNLSDNIYDNKSLEEIENILTAAVSDEKMRSINFKDERNVFGNQLIEFRIMGNRDYNKRIEDITKAVVKYATIMQAGNDSDLYRKDYIKSLFKLISSAFDIKNDARQVQMSNLNSIGNVDKNVIAAFNAVISSKNFNNTLSNLSLAYSKLRDRSGGQIQESMILIETNAAFELYEPIAHVFNNLVSDVINNNLRTPITAKYALGFRQVLKDFNISIEDLIEAIESATDFIHDVQEKYHIRHEKLVNALRVIFKNNSISYKTPNKIINMSPNDILMVKIQVSMALKRLALGYSTHTNELNSNDVSDFNNDVVIMDNQDFTEYTHANENLPKLKNLVDELQTDLRNESDQEQIEVKKSLIEKFGKKHKKYMELVDEIEKKYNIQSGNTWVKIGRYETIRDIERLYNVQINRPRTESVHDEFDRLPLEEKLRIVDGLDNGYWHRDKAVKAYEPKPKKVKPTKGPESKHPYRGRLVGGVETKERNVDEPTKKKPNGRRKNLPESVPNNSASREVEKLLSDHFPVGDMTKQMDAYLAVPVPEMLDAFKMLHRQMGPDACARNILRHYAQEYYSETVNEARTINVSKSFINAKMMDSEYRSMKKHSTLLPDLVLGKYPVRMVDLSPHIANLFVLNKEEKFPIMYFELEKIGSAYVVVASRLRKSFQGQGLGHKIYASLVKDFGMTLVSDESQSEGARKVWADLAQTPGIVTYAWLPKHGSRESEFKQIDVNDIKELETADGYAYFDRDNIEFLKAEMEKELQAADSKEQRKQISKRYKNEIEGMFDALPVRIVATPQKGLGK